MAQHQGPRRRRSPDDIVILTGATVIWGETQPEAKLDQVASLWPIDVAMANMGIDFLDHDLDDPFPEVYVPVFSKGRSATIAHHATSNGLTIRQAVHRVSVGLGHRSVIGTTQSTSDHFSAWIEAEAPHGFALIQPRLTHGLRDVIFHVVLEPKRCRLFKGEYTGLTPRKNLDLKRPENLHLLRKVARTAAQ